MTGFRSSTRIRRTFGFSPAWSSGPRRLTKKIQPETEYRSRGKNREREGDNLIARLKKRKILVMSVIPKHLSPLFKVSIFIPNSRYVRNIAPKSIRGSLRQSTEIFPFVEVLQDDVPSPFCQKKIPSSKVGEKSSYSPTSTTGKA